MGTDGITRGPSHLSNAKIESSLEIPKEFTENEKRVGKIQKLIKAIFGHKDKGSALIKTSRAKIPSIQNKAVDTQFVKQNGVKNKSVSSEPSTTPKGDNDDQKLEGELVSITMETSMGILF